jgi:hypothetical protein
MNFLWTLLITQVTRCRMQPPRNILNRLHCAVTSVRLQRAAPVSPAGNWLAGQ